MHHIIVVSQHVRHSHRIIFATLDAQTASIYCYVIIKHRIIKIHIAAVDIHAAAVCHITIVVVERHVVHLDIAFKELETDAPAVTSLKSRAHVIVNLAVVNVKGRILSINGAASFSCSVMMKTAIVNLHIICHKNLHHATVAIQLCLSIREIAMAKLNLSRFLTEKAFPSASFRIVIVRITGGICYSECNFGIRLA